MTGNQEYPPALYMLGTPIGNLEDISRRATTLLSEADVIFSETPSHTRKLLRVLGRDNCRIIRAREFEMKSRADQVIAFIEEKKKVVYVSDAGTPGIQDPGSVLVDRVLEAGKGVVPIPGPSALTALLSVCGFRVDRFFFEGFLPLRKGKRRRRLEELRELGVPLVLFESVHRIDKLIGLLEKIIPERRMVLGREITKKFEQVIRGYPGEIGSRISSGEIPRRGEFALVVEGED